MTHQMMHHMMGEMMGGHGTGLVLVMAILGLFALVGLATTVVWVVRLVRGGTGRFRVRERAGTPLETLGHRYAAGGLSREEFERLKRESAEA
jgi:uncharacterized membrane protein